MKAAFVLSLRSRRALFQHRSKQSGVVMFVALAVLILMTLAGLAMLRQMGSSVSIAGNLAFKQNATAAGDLGTETARAVRSPQAAERLGEQGFEASGAGPEQFSPYIRDEIARYAKIIKDANIKVE